MPSARSSDVRSVLLLLAASTCLAQEITAEKLIEAGHWKRARALVERRLEAAPDDPNALFLSSQIRNAFGDRTAPGPLAEKAVKLAPGVARYHRQVAEVQGVMAQHAGMFQQLLLAHRFRKEIDTAIALDPRDVQARRDLLEYYLLAPGIAGGDPARADETAAAIAGLDAAEGLLAKARIAEFHKDQTLAHELLRKAAALRPPSFKAVIALAEFELAPEHRDEAAAETAAKLALTLDPTRIAPYNILAAIYASRGDWTALDTLLESAAREVPDDAAPYYRAAASLLAENRATERAARYLRMYLTEEPEGNEPTAADARRLLDAALRGASK